MHGRSWRYLPFVVLGAVIGLVVTALGQHSAAGYGPGVGVGELDRRPISAVGVPPDAATASYNVMARQPDGSPVTWSPCRPIHWVYRPDGGTEQAEQFIHAAVDEVSAATGLQFVFDGYTSEPADEYRQPYLPDRYPGRWAPVLIAWATPSEVPRFSDITLGVAAPRPVTGSDGTQEYVSGVVYFDPEMIRYFAQGYGHQVFLHELGHLAGLHHVADGNEIMGGRSSTGYGPGDLTGLAVMGSGSCHRGI